MTTGDMIFFLDVAIAVMLGTTVVLSCVVWWTRERRW